MCEETFWLCSKLQVFIWSLIRFPGMKESELPKNYHRSYIVTSNESSHFMSRWKRWRRCCGWYPYGLLQLCSILCLYKSWTLGHNKQWTWIGDSGVSMFQLHLCLWYLQCSSCCSYLSTTVCLCHLLANTLGILEVSHISKELVLGFLLPSSLQWLLPLLRENDARYKVNLTGLFLLAMSLKC